MRSGKIPMTMKSKSHTTPYSMVLRWKCPFLDMEEGEVFLQLEYFSIGFCIVLEGGIQCMLKEVFNVC